MTKDQFIEQFVVQFLATHAANIYPDACAYGKHELLEKLPVEDALDIAYSNWEHFNEVME